MTTDRSETAEPGAERSAGPHGDGTPAGFSSNAWRARWIWCEPPPIGLRALGTPTLADTTPRIALFRRRFTVARPPERAPARFTADSRYVLWLNGVELARGPVRDNPRRLHADGVDLAPHLRRGANALAILVCFYGEAAPWWMPAPPTFALGAGSLLFEAELATSGRLASDASWRALRCDGWRLLRPPGISAAPLESLDARVLPAGWQGVDFDDSSWSAATELGSAFVGTAGVAEPPSHPFGALPPRPIPFLSGATRHAARIGARFVAGGATNDDPVAQVELDAASPALDGARGDGVELLTFDFGEHVAGTLRLELDAPAGARLDLAVAEGLKADGSLDRLGQHTGLRYVARGAADRCETIDALGCRFVQIAVRGGGAPVVLRRLDVKERLYPRPPGVPFRCSDPLLERVWAAGRRTVDLCSHDAYLDCPTREQRAWTGDSVVHAMVDLATNPDWRLARRHVALAASLRPDGMFPMAVAGDLEVADSTFIPDWPLHWVHALHAVFRYAGDRALVSALLAPAECLLRWFLPFQERSGLLANVTGWVLIDWSAVSVAGACAALNALYARALREFGEMAEWLGDRGRADWARSVHEALRAGFAAFWDEARGVYVDHLRDGAAQLPVSEHANAAALCAGLVPEERVPRVAATLLDRTRLVRASWLLPGRTSAPEDGDMYGDAATLITGPPPPWWDVEHKIVAAQPFFRYVVHEALAASGRAEALPALCRDWGELLERCPATLSETWFGGSRCHGWSATPTRDLIAFTLGIGPAEPGFARARIAPRLGDLEWAAGAAPTPYGWISVDATHEWIEVESPVPLELDLPTGEVVHRAAGRHRLPL